LRKTTATTGSIAASREAGGSVGDRKEILAALQEAANVCEHVWPMVSSRLTPFEACLSRLNLNKMFLESGKGSVSSAIAA
jgi:hypothetical protein